MTGAAMSLTASYAMLGLLLLSLQLQSSWSWQVKAVAVCTALPLFVATFLAWQAMLGWPSDDDLPATFQVHAALVEEPSAGGDRTGAIYLWVTPKESQENRAAPDSDPIDVDIVNSSSPPRAFALPYSRDLHSRIEAMREAMRKGEMVEGRSRPGSPLERRFGRQQGAIDLYAPPSPPLPSKNG